MHNEELLERFIDDIDWIELEPTYIIKDNILTFRVYKNKKIWYEVVFDFNYENYDDIIKYLENDIDNMLG